MNRTGVPGLEGERAQRQLAHFESELPALLAAQAEAMGERRAALAALQRARASGDRAAIAYAAERFRGAHARASSAAADVRACKNAARFFLDEVERGVGDREAASA